MRSRRPPSLFLLALVLLATAVAVTWSVRHPGESAQANAHVSPDDDPYWGPVDAAVAIIEFSDYQCPYCRIFYEQTLPQIQTTYAGQVRFVYRDFPLSSIHAYAQKAAEASECADDQGRFWEYHALLWANQQALDVSSLKDYAADLGLDTATFDDCLDSGKNAQEVEDDYADGVGYGVNGTPWFFINDEPLAGAQPFSAFQEIIDPLLAIAPTPSPTTSPAPRGQLHNCPSADGWSLAVWSGLDDTLTGDALATCGEAAVTAAYSLDPATGSWWRYFSDRPELSTLAALDNLQAIFAQGSGSASGSVGPAPLAGAANQLQNCPQPGVWTLSTWDGPHGTATGQALATCPTSVAAAYALDPLTQGWLRYFDGRPEINDLVTVDNMQAVLTLGATEP